MKKQNLELTWIGKELLRLEPTIFNTENISVPISLFLAAGQVKKDK